MGLDKRKEVLRMMSYGVYILASKNKNEFCSTTVTWVSQASFEPPMLSVCLKRNSGAYFIVKERGEFILHMLSKDQKEMASKFFKSAILDGNELNGEKFHLVDDLPVLLHSPSYIHCNVLEILEKGDHPLFLSEIKNVFLNTQVKPLELRETGWNYGG